MHRFKNRDRMTVESMKTTLNKQAGFVPACLLCTLLLTFSVSARVDTSTVIASDSIHRPLRELGQLSINSDRADLDLTKARIRSMQYRGLAELLTRATGGFPRSLGGFGQHNNLTFYGEDPAAHTVSIQGRELYDPWTQRFHLEQWSVEGLERIQILHGTDALGLGAGMSLHAVNMQQVIHDTRTPITRLWYGQGGGEFIAGDVTLSQNVAANLNSTIGVRRSGAIGRFDQTAFDVWNVRAGIRWAPSARIHTQLSYDLSSFNTDQWGGVAADDLSSLTEASAVPVFASLRDLSRRHDLQLSGAYIIAEDTSVVLHGSIYGTYASLRRIGDTTLTYVMGRATGDDVVRSGIGGAQMRLEQRVGDARILVGSSLDILSIDKSVITDAANRIRAQAWGHATIPFARNLDLRLAVRVLADDHTTQAGAGACITYRPNDHASFALDAATSPRSPGPTERTPDGDIPIAERHTLVRFVATSTTEIATGSVEAFYRGVDAPIAGLRGGADDGAAPRSDNTSALHILGAITQGRFRVGSLEFSGILRCWYVPSDHPRSMDLPTLAGNVTAEYVYQTAANNVRFGCTIGGLSAISGPGYSPLTWTFTDRALDQRATINGVDAHITATVGNAVVRAAMENILGVPWFSVAGYPEISRNFRLSLHWSFFD